MGRTGKVHCGSQDAQDAEDVHGVVVVEEALVTVAIIRGMVSPTRVVIRMRL
jgi:hypothetical protein